MLRTLGNLLWLVLGGFVMGLGWWIAGLQCAVTIIGIPFGLQHLKLAGMSLAPIGKTIIDAR